MKPRGDQTPSTAAGRSPRRVRDLVIRFLLFMGLWLLLSGHYDAEHLFYGALSVALVLAVNGPVWRSPVEVDVDEDRWEFAPTLVNWPRLALYLAWLIKEIAVANVQVASMVLNPKLPVDPVLVGFRVGLRSPIARTTLGNSITLTPGTLTLEIQEDWFLVHALAESSAKSLLDGGMQGRVAGVYRYDQGMVGSARIYTSREEFWES